MASASGTSRRQPIRVCYVIPDMFHGGAQRQLYNLATQLSERFEPFILNMHQGSTAQEFHTLLPRMTELRYRGNGDAVKVLQLRRVLHVLRPDIVHCFLPSGNFYGLLAAAMTRVRIRVAGERSLGTRFRGLRRILYPRVFPLATAIVTNSIENRDWLRARHPRADVQFIPNGCRVDTSLSESGQRELRRSLGLPDGESAPPLIATVTHLTPEKDVACLIRAVAQIVNRGVDLRLLVVGDGPLRSDITDLIDRCRLRGHVTLTGHLPREQAVAVAQICDVFVLPSRHEGMPNALMEAMAYARPCIATTVGGIPELLRDEAGVLVPPEDDARLAEALVEVLAKKALRMRLGKNAQTRIREYSVEKMVETHECLYLRLMDAQQSAA